MPQVAVSVDPFAINTQNWACLSINSFFDDIHNTSHQSGCCNDRLSSPSLDGHRSACACAARGRAAAGPLAPGLLDEIAAGGDLNSRRSARLLGLTGRGPDLPHRAGVKIDMSDIDCCAVLVQGTDVHTGVARWR